jgi:hypothetical protein
MRNIYRALVLAVVVVGAALAADRASAQQNVVCTGQLAAGTYNNVTVPTGAACGLNLTAVTVISNVTIRSGSICPASATLRHQATAGLRIL